MLLRKHEKSKTEASFLSSTSDCAAPGETLLSVPRSAPKNQNTNNIVRRMAHRNGEGVALGTLIGLFRTKGRKGSRIVRGYLHTNSIMVIRDAPLEALEAPSSSLSRLLSLPVLSSRLYSPSKKSPNLRERRGVTFSHSLSFFSSGRSSTCVSS